jgi:hypothetical protein
MKRLICLFVLVACTAHAQPLPPIENDVLVTIDPIKTGLGEPAPVDLSWAYRATFSAVEIPNFVTWTELTAGDQGPVHVQTTKHPDYWDDEHDMWTFQVETLVGAIFRTPSGWWRFTVPKTSQFHPGGINYGPDGAIHLVRGESYFVQLIAIMPDMQGGGGHIEWKINGEPLVIIDGVRAPNGNDVVADGGVTSLDLLFAVQYHGGFGPGDADLDGDVDFADFLILSENLGEPGGWGQGNFNLDDQVDSADLFILSENFGASS